MNRRSFLGQLGISGTFVPRLATLGEILALAGSGAAAAPQRRRELAADVVIAGGGMGGVGAALAAARNGLTVILTEETDWIGGQVTQQAVPLDEHPYIESFGCTRTYREYRNRIRDYYRRNYPLTNAARTRWNLSLGNATMPLTHEPPVSLAVFYEMLAKYLGNGSVTILLNTIPVSATVTGDRVRGIVVRDTQTGLETGLSGRWFVDATETGDLLPLTKAEYVTGSESRADTGELHAPGKADSSNEQGFTWCFALDYLDGEDHTIEKPSGYAYWRDFVPVMHPAYTGKLLSFDSSLPTDVNVVRKAYLDPLGRNPKPVGRHNLDLWIYRRLIDRTNFDPGTYRSDITLVNWPQNDYNFGRVIDVSPAERAKHMEAGKQLSLSLLYWLQTEAPQMKGDKRGFPGLRLRKDLVGTADGLAKYPYIRESRRIRAEFTLREQHVGLEMRMKETGLDRTQVRAVSFPDSVGIGLYRIDLHPSTAGDNYIDISSLPFELPLGALLPVRLENLIPASKNIGTTHITNGCYRLHHIEWNIGETVGCLAAFCSRKGVMPRQVRSSASNLSAFQNFIVNDGIEIAWPRPLPR